MNDSASSYYTVKSGDTLSEIAEQHGTTLDELIALNKIEDPDLIYPGQELKLKDDGQPAEQRDDEPAKTREAQPAE